MQSPNLLVQKSPTDLKRQLLMQQLQQRQSKPTTALEAFGQGMNKFAKTLELNKEIEDEKQTSTDLAEAAQAAAGQWKNPDTGEHVGPNRMENLASIITKMNNPDLAPYAAQYALEGAQQRDARALNIEDTERARTADFDTFKQKSAIEQQNALARLGFAHKLKQQGKAVTPMEGQAPNQDGAIPLFQGNAPYTEGLEKGFQWGETESGQRVAIPIAGTDAANSNEKGEKTKALTLELVDSLLGNEGGVRSNFGPIDESMFSPNLFPSTRRAATDLGQLRSVLTVENLGLLKGVMSDNDIKMLERVGAGQFVEGADEDSVISALKNLRTALGGDKPEGSPEIGDAVIDGRLNYASPRVQEAFNNGYTEQQIMQKLGGGF